MRFAPFVLVLLAMPVLAATVWKWRDADGVMHYSDQPVPGAEQMNVQESSTFTTSNSAPNTAATRTPVTNATASYSNVEIWKPGNDESITNTEGQVAVAVRVEPALQAGDRLALYLDGRLVSGFPQQGMEYQLSAVDRGSHNLQLVVVDPQGKQVKSSAAVTFHLLQPSVLNKKAR